MPIGPAGGAVSFWAMHDLSARQWHDIAQAWRRLAAIPPRDFDGLRDGLADEARALFAADWVALMVGVLEEDPNGPLDGWRAKLVENPHVDARTFTEMAAAMRAGLYVHDPTVRRVVAGAGRSRVVTRDPGPLPEGPRPMRDKLDAWGIRDQILGVVTLTPEVELYFAVTRLGDAPEFTADDVRLLQAFLDGTETPARHLARSYGLLGPVPLTPRQRQAVSLLLRGLSEKEMAAEIGVSTSTAHEYVVEAYRKLGVRSRPELIALWMDTGRR